MNIPETTFKTISAVAAALALSATAQTQGGYMCSGFGCDGGDGLTGGGPNIYEIYADFHILDQNFHQNQFSSMFGPPELEERIQCFKDCGDDDTLNRQACLGAYGTPVPDESVILTDQRETCLQVTRQDHIECLQPVAIRKCLN